MALTSGAKKFIKLAIVVSIIGGAGYAAKDKLPGLRKGGTDQVSVNPQTPADQSTSASPATSPTVPPAAPPVAAPIQAAKPEPAPATPRQHVATAPKKHAARPAAKPTAHHAPARHHDAAPASASEMKEIDALEALSRKGL